jgi:hypothetical protein
VERVPQRTELLSGVQRGNEVILSWPAPRVNAPDSSVQSIRRIDVYRLAEKLDAPLPLTESEFAAKSTLVGSVPESAITGAAGSLTYVDNLELAGPSSRLRYAVRYVNAAGQRAGFSNFLLVEPSGSISAPPVLSEPVLTEPAINLNWTAPTKNIDGSQPANILGYNLYRFSQGQEDPGSAPLNSTLISTTSYADRSFKFGQNYRYLARTVSLGSNGQQVESLNSNVVSANPKDIYPPAAPERITIAPAPGRLSLFFPQNQEGDIAGYNIYRSTDPNLPLEQWAKLNDELLTRTTYQDQKVESGRKYYYYLRAVDTSGNVSAPSEIFSETAP